MQPNNPAGGGWRGFANLFRAEWIKIAGNRWVAGCLIWIFPIMTLLFIVIVAFILGLSPSARDGFSEDEAVLWTENATSVWNIANNPIGRIILLGFTAVVFAGEYQWQTWKNTVPRHQRTALVLIKFLVVGVFVVVAFVTMSIILAVGWWPLTEIAGTDYGPPISGDVLADFAEDYSIQASITFTSTIIAAGYAALAGMLTRSILGGVLVAFGLTVAEGASLLAFALLAWLLDIPEIVHIYRFLPFYNLLNVATWINDDRPERLVMEDFDINHADSLEFSLVVLAAWVIGLMTLTVLLFRRQDITT